MASTFQCSTPPPHSSTLHTPSTPKYGKDDNYEPYSPRRRSSRVSHQQATRTPPRRGQANFSSPSSSTKKSYASLGSSPSSPQTTTKKQTPGSSPIMGRRGTSRALDAEKTAYAASVLGLPATRRGGKKESQQSALRNTGMLPTPAKTPKKEPSTDISAITAVARNLFPIRGETADEVMPSPKKKGRKRYTGMTLDSFEAEEEGPITIYTDSHDRIPEIDESSDNPFYGESTAAVPEPIKRTSKRRKVAISGEEDQLISEAEKREDGLVYVFRGKKIFRKFTDQDLDESGSVGQPEVGVDSEILERRLDRPLTRSSVKPRLLFPTSKQVKAKEMRSQVTEDEEEAITDIEEQDPLTPTHVVGAVTTPKAPRFAPASPPTTARVTRSKDVTVYSSPPGPVTDDEFRSSSASRDGKLSPFEGWRKTKTAAASGGKKRGGEPLVRAKGTKKTRT